MAQAETEFRSLKFTYTKEKLKCALLGERVTWYRDKLNAEKQRCELMEEQVKGKELVEKKLEDASTALVRLGNELSASNEVIKELQGQLVVLKQKASPVTSETADLKEALRKERKRVLDLSSHLKSSHRAVKESIAKQVSLQEALSVQEKKCARLRRKIELDQVEMRRIRSREQDLHAALDIDKTIMAELSSRLADHQKLTEELKAALDATTSTIKHGRE